MNHEFSCQCGKLKGHVLHKSKNDFVSVACHCKFCRSFSELGGDHAKYKTHGNFVALAQAKPWEVEITKGEDRLGYLKLSKKGPNRCFATCCNTPMFITLTKVFPPFVSFHVGNFTDPSRINTPRYFAFAKTANRDQRPKQTTILALSTLLPRITGRVLLSLIGQKYKRTPFFDQNGNPSAQKVDFSKAEKSALFELAANRLEG